MSDINGESSRLKFCGASFFEGLCSSFHQAAMQLSPSLDRSYKAIYERYAAR